MADIDSHPENERDNGEPSFQALAFSKAFEVCKRVEASTRGQGTLGPYTVKLQVDDVWPRDEFRFPDLESSWTRVPMGHPANDNLLSALHFVGSRQDCHFEVNGQDPTQMDWVQWPCHVTAKVNKPGKV